MNKNDILTMVRTGDYSPWIALGVKERWHVLRDDLSPDDRKEIGEALGSFGGDMSHSLVSLGAAICRRADPERAAILREAFR